MRTFKTIFTLAILVMMMACSTSKTMKTTSDTNSMMIRIAEIEILPEYLDEYLKILKEESSASVKLEPGVISLYPMYQKENPTQIRLLEIYASKEAYESHIASEHFKYYKTTTLKMVKSLKLVELESIAPETMNQIFKKLSNH
jgi:quinol monooxygenase YgiN